MSDPRFVDMQRPTTTGRCSILRLLLCVLCSEGILPVLCSEHPSPCPYAPLSEAPLRRTQWLRERGLLSSDPVELEVAPLSVSVDPVSRNLVLNSSAPAPQTMVADPATVALTAPTPAATPQPGSELSTSSSFRRCIRCIFGGFVGGLFCCIVLKLNAMDSYQAERHGHRVNDWEGPANPSASRFGSVSACAEQHCGRLMSIDDCVDGQSAYSQSWLHLYQGCRWAESKCEQRVTELGLSNAGENLVLTMSNEKACGLALEECLLKNCHVHRPLQNAVCTLEEGRGSGIYLPVPGSCPEGQKCLKFRADYRHATTTEFKYMKTGIA